MAATRQSVRTQWAERYPDKAGEERALRQARKEAERDFGHKRNGTVQTHARHAQASVVRQGSLARLHLSGAISTEQLGWALEIAAEHERIDADVAIRSASIETRVDGGKGGEAVFFESLGRVRRAVAYTRWRAALPALGDYRPEVWPRLMAMVVDDLGLVQAARQARVSVRRARKLLIDALELWPTLLGEVKRDVGEGDVAWVEARLGEFAHKDDIQRP